MEKLNYVKKVIVLKSLNLNTRIRKRNSIKPDLSKITIKW